jgi:Cft2 family RNA processing exonuclease
MSEFDVWQGIDSPPARPILTEDDLEDIRAAAEMAGPGEVVTSARLCRTGAMLSVATLCLTEARDLVAAAGYTVRIVQERLIVTGAIDRLTLLVAERDRLTAEITALQAETAVAAR